jgi:ABC-type multidrug transport system ATPase subunit
MGNTTVDLAPIKQAMQQSSTVLEVDNLQKNYKNIKALKGVSFSVPKGSVYGILGPNGSGKTTLLALIMEVINGNGGSFKWFGVDGSAAMRKYVGTLLETPNFYHYLNAVDNLTIAAHIKGQDGNDIDAVLKTVNLYERRLSAFNSYSLGMKQRLAIASALLGNPDVLVFDEPTNGLDPQGIAEIRNLIKDLHAKGKTIIMASHILDEVEKVCTHVAILKFGDLLVDGPVETVLRNEDIALLNCSNNNELIKVIKQLPNITGATILDSGLQVTFAENTINLAAVNKHCFDNGIVLSEIKLNKKSLETKFIEITA